MNLEKVFAIAALCLLRGSLYAADSAAQNLLREAINAQGGETALRAIHTMQYTAVGYRNLLEQSERPEGPYFVSFTNITMAVDFDQHTFFEKRESATYPVEKFMRATTVDRGVAMVTLGTQKMPGTPEQVEIASETAALSPVRLLLTALDASNVQLEKDTELQSVPQNVILFYLDGAPVRIYLNAYTHLPTAVDYSGPEALGDYGKFLGDVTQRTYYSLWWLAKGGVHLPMQWNTELNGLPDRMTVINKLQINDPVSDEETEIPAEIRTKFDPKSQVRSLDALPLGLPAQPASEIAPGVVFIPGRWNVTLVKQDDGIVILETPISSGYSEKVIAESHRRFPNLPIKAVITTSDSWPHIAGIRQYAAEGVPIYALNLNEPALRRLLAMPYANRPDALQRSPREAVFHWIHEKTVIGTGANRLEIYPIHGETGERQMMVFFPQHHLLYGSDLFQQLPDGSFFYPQTVNELIDAVGRENLSVDHFFMMHIGMMPWGKLGEAIKAAKKSESPTGVQ